MPTFERRNLEIDEISVCESGANEGAKIFFFKSNDKEQLMDVEKIEDVELKKEIEAFLKEQIEKDVKFDDLQKEHDKLVKANEIKAKEDEPIEKKIEKLPEDMQKVWDESQELIKKAQEDAQTAKNEVAELRKEAMQKETAKIVEGMPRIAASPEDRKQLETLLMKMDKEDKEGYLEALRRAEKIAGEADSIFKEMGRPNAVQGDTADKVDTLAKELVAKSTDPITIVQARVKIREMNPDLRDEQETS